MNSTWHVIPVFVTAFAVTVTAQTTPVADPTSSIETAKLIGVEQALAEMSKPASESSDIRQLFLRQQITEAVLSASLDVDSVLAEIQNEHGRLLEIRSVLQAKRDRAANLISVANLVLGTGLGIVTNAMQFHDSTAIAGDVIGVGSGAASTLLSVLGIRLQNGPQRSIGRTPNMLAVLFGRTPVLHSEYPQIVLVYLHSVPQGEAAERGTRLEQLRREWEAAGRLGPPGAKGVDAKIERMTASLNPSRKLSIADVTDRAFLLEDVAGRVGLMQRDLASLMHRLLPSGSPATVR